jgi:Tfp pilus assembly protein PilZ
VTEAVAAAAKIIWLDPSSAANRLRTAVERVLDHQKVRKVRLTKKRTPCDYLLTLGSKSSRPKTRRPATQ